MMSHEDDQLRDVMGALAPLAPGPAEGPRPASQVLSEVRKRMDSNTPLNRRFSDMFKRKYTWAAAAVVVVVALFTIPAVRAAASDFLGLFRVQKFAAISVSPQQLALLEELAESGLYPGELQLTGEPSEAVVVDSIDAAAAAAGFPVRTPVEQGEPAKIEVSEGGTGRLIVNVANARALMEAAGADPALIPDSLDGQPVSVTLSPGVALEYPSGVSLVQMPSPEVEYPAEVDPAAIGEALLQVLGMEPRDAARLAASLDWTTTLLVPIPANVASFGEVEVDGVLGLGLSDFEGRHAALIWQKGGMVYVLTGFDMDQLVAVAEQMQ
jgi:hypothetical protein